MSFRIYKDTRSPSIADTLRVDGEAFDLTGASVTFRMRAVGSSTLVVDSAATVVTAASGTVRYDWQAGDVDTAGDYLGWWRVTLSNGRVQESPEFAVEVVEHSDTATSLVTLAEVREALEYPEDEDGRDRLIEALIPQVTDAIQRETQREFTATASATRSFLWKRGTAITMTPYDLRSVTSLIVHPGADEQDTAVEGTDFRLKPYPSRDGVYTRIEFAPDYSPSVSDYESSFGAAKVNVAGAWGWETVPAAVKRAAILTVAAWMTADIASNALADLDEPRGLAPPMPAQYAIPTPAWRLLAPFMRRTVR